MLRRRDFTALLLPVLCAGAPQDGDWQTIDAKSAGFRPVALDKLTADIRNGAYPNTHAVLIEREGRLLYEQYFAGTDERWGQPIGKRTLDRNGLHDLRSASKSVTGAVLGIALGADFEKALSRPIGSFFPRLKLRPELDAVTLHHVLTMTAGLEWNEMTTPYTDPNNDELRMYTVKDPVAQVLSHRLRDKPGTVWYYNGGLTQVLAGVVREVTGKPFSDYAKQALFTPLGVTEYEWLGGPAWDPPQPSAASGLRMRARDLARFGSVYLHQGKWQGRQIVPAEWVERSLRRHVVSNGDWSGAARYGYGYQWWIGTPGGHEAAAAVGNGNQRVFVAGKERVAITIFAGEYNKFEGHSERIFSAVMSARA